jgi:hypothetical protein
MPTNQVADVSQRQNFYCKLFINDVEIIPQNIISCTIREWIFDLLPRLELIIMDDGLLTEAKTLKDNTTIHLLFGRDINDDHLVEVEFIKQDHSVDIISNRITNITITGFLNTTNTFFPLYNRAFHNKSSVDVLRSIASEMNLTYETSQNLLTNDSMNWLQINQTNDKMIKHILKRSFKSNDTMFCYASINNKLNYKSLAIEANNTQTTNAKLDLRKYSDNVLQDEDRTTIWFNTYDIKNIEGFANRTAANAQKFSYLDYNTMQVQNQVVNSNIPTLVDDVVNSNTAQSVNYTNFGLLFTNVNQRNVFNKYFEAQILNEYIKWGFFNQSILININASKTVNLFDKIMLTLPSLIEENVNDVYSGEYIVGGILHNLSKNSIYRKQLSLHRAGINRSNFGVS